MAKSLIHKLTQVADNDFERAMARETLTNEIRRMSIILVMMSLIFSFFLFLWIFDPQDLFSGTDSGQIHKSLIAIVCFLVYESTALLILRHLKNTGRQPPTLARFTNAFAETSVPTVIIYLFSGLTSPAESLFSPPSYAYFLFILLSTLRLNFSLPLFTGIVAAVEYAGLVFIFRDQLSAFPEVTMFRAFPVHLAKVIFYLFGGVIAGLVALGIRQSFERSLRSVEERNEIREIFGKHVSPEVVDKLLSQQNETDSETRHICVMFLDIRNFTTFSENRTPEEVVEYLNTVFDFMIDIINQNRGIVNKFLGDGFMAVFGAPLSDGVDSQNALSAARDIITEVNRRSAAGEIPQTRIGIGLHAGHAVTGNVGSRTRREYTIIGDTVNVASRIETLNKQFGSQLLMSETVRSSILEGKHELPDHEQLEPLQVKGRAEPVQVYKVL